jgi:two-component system response regulator protein BraR/BceR
LSDRRVEVYKIYIVEDDPVIARSIKEYMNLWGYDALEASDFASVLQEFVRYDPQLVLMDISLPFYNGFHWCTEIRKISKVPIMFLSSASDNMHMIMAMNMGADDYIVKPFDLSVMLAKVQALLRRAYDFGGHSHLIEHRGVIFNSTEHTISFENDKLELTKNENRILQVLLGNKGKVVSRETLMTKLWESDEFVDENTLSVNVARLRKKLERLGLEDFVTTKKGLGYMVK